MEEDILAEIPTAKVFKKKTILVCTFLTGPLVAGFMIAENYKAFGERSNQIKAIIITVIFLLALFYCIFEIPQFENIPSFIFTLFNLVVASACVHFLQARKLSQHLANGGTSYGAERAIIVSIVGLLMTLALGVGISFLLGISQ